MLFPFIALLGFSLNVFNLSMLLLLLEILTIAITGSFEF